MTHEDSYERDTTPLLIIRVAWVFYTQYSLTNCIWLNSWINLMVDGYQCPRVTNYDFTSTIELQDNHSWFFFMMHRPVKSWHGYTFHITDPFYRKSAGFPTCTVWLWNNESYSRCPNVVQNTFYCKGCISCNTSPSLTHWPLGDVELILQMYFSKLILWIVILTTSCEIDLSHKSHNTFNKYCTMHHFVTEMCTYGTGALWDLWNSS